ncbi:MAG: purine-nucleoside phosphorylase [Pseudomonadota bacterium]
MNALGVIQDALGGASPDVAIVLGSGLGALADHVSEAVHIPYEALPGFPQPTVSGHAGSLVAGDLGGVPVVLLRGRAHYYEDGDAAAMRAPLETLKTLGVSTLILTNAAGSLQPEVGPGRAMLITDHINLTGRNPLIGVASDDRFVAMENAYDPALCRVMRDTAAERGVQLAEGTYMWFSGPSFETPAEIRMARTLGADAVGMSTVPEVILARWLGLRVAAVSMITNLGAGMSETALSHDQTKDVAGGAADMMERLIVGFLEHLAAGEAALPESGETA